MSKRNVLLGLALLVLAAIAAGIAWNRYQTQQLQDATLARIGDATRALRAAVAPAPDVDAADHARAVAASAAHIDRTLTALRDTETGRILLLAAGADSYLHTARELLRRQAAILQLRAQVSEGVVAFRAHFTVGNRAAADWTSEAVRLKNSMEQDYREFQRTVDAHTKIADSLPVERKALEKLVPEDRLIGAAEITAMREAVQAAATALAGEVHAARQLAAPR
ncbi:MAG: hypothetical protein EHM16_14815 [Betaproteobacteria bacterium]|nr:MAG: hypothetical protein EHM16_14815 [Betaproteobacteria bacterium]